jgi:nitrate reductase delta subunit
VRESAASPEGLATTCKALSALLDYPTETLLGLLPEVAAALGPAHAAQLCPLLDRLAQTELLDLQADYVDTFDRGRRVALNLFEHVHGDSRDRGQAMVDLLAQYRAAGLTPSTEQLPDYLPVFLEYVALLPPDAARAHLQEIAHILQTIGAVLTRRGSVYAAAFDCLLQTAGATAAAPPAEEEDDSLAALDAAYAEAPVQFLGAADPGCAGARPTEQPIHLMRRAA